MEAQRRRGSQIGGYLFVLVGAVGFVVSCFLPYLGGESLIPMDESVSVSLYRLISSGLPSDGFERLGDVLYLFAGAATVGVISLAGIGWPRDWTRYALVAATAAWTLTWIGILISQAGFGPHEVGYWSLFASMGVAIVGTIIVWVSALSKARESTPIAAESLGS
jgi:hypothetical protein